MNTLLELFSGSKTVAREFEKQGFNTFTIDNDPKLKPDLVADISKLKKSDLPEPFRKPTVVWASPPCTEFSKARGGRSDFSHANRHRPKSPSAIEAIELVHRTLRFITELNPSFWILENPRGFLRDQGIMKHYPRTTVAYCQYGVPYQKYTDLWGKFPILFTPRSVCHHFSHPNIKLDGNAYTRSIVPQELAADMAESCKNSSGFTSWQKLDLGI